MKRNGVLVLLVALAIITFLDRISIAVAGARIQDELHISPERWGWILGAFVLAYGIFEIPTGALGDRSGHKNVLTRIVLWWSAFTCLTGLATGFNVLLATRFLFGMGEAGAYPNMSGVIARWFPVTERARTQGFIWAASRFGGALSPLIVVPLQSIVGWRVTSPFWALSAFYGCSAGKLCIATGPIPNGRKRLRTRAFPGANCCGNGSSGSSSRCIGATPGGRGFSLDGFRCTW